MIDITTIQSFPVPPSIKALQEANNTLKLAKDSLTSKNELLQKILIVSFISLGLLVFVKILKTNKEQKQ
jgi:hypothetical protein